MKNTCVFLTICALFVGCQSNKKQYYEKHLVFPEGSTIEQKVEMAAHLTPTPQQLSFWNEYIYQSGMGRREGRSQTF